ncbi:MAG: class I fructose-bisphosphate aldolase [Acidimicrobiales bacterium]
MQETATALVAPAKGILAADESAGTIERRFEAVSLESTENSRRAYRELLFTTPGIEDFLSGVILFDETIRQQASDGTPFTVLLGQRGIMPGIKVDMGTVPLAAPSTEVVTEGLDGLRERLDGYVKLGAGFAKWRAVIRIGDGTPSPACLSANAQLLARYASLCQEAGLVPIVEPEVLMDGEHSLERCRLVTRETQHRVFEALHTFDVRLDEMLLKPNMVLSGKDSAHQAAVEEVADATLACLKETVPPAVPGIVFLSGGQSPELATAHLNALHTRGPLPWEVSFSFARALQDPALAVWRGDPARRDQAQAALLHRVRCNAAARQGQYHSDMEQAA